MNYGMVMLLNDVFHENDDNIDPLWCYNYQISSKLELENYTLTVANDTDVQYLDNITYHWFINLGCDADLYFDLNFSSGDGLQGIDYLISSSSSDDNYQIEYHGYSRKHNLCFRTEIVNIIESNYCLNYTTTGTDNNTYSHCDTIFVADTCEETDYDSDFATKFPIDYVPVPGGTHDLTNDEMVNGTGKYTLQDDLVVLRGWWIKECSQEIVKSKIGNYSEEYLVMNVELYKDYLINSLIDRDNYNYNYNHISGDLDIDFLVSRPILLPAYDRLVIPYGCAEIQGEIVNYKILNDTVILHLNLSVSPLIYFKSANLDIIEASILATNELNLHNNTIVVCTVIETGDNYLIESPEDLNIINSVYVAPNYTLECYATRNRDDDNTTFTPIDSLLDNTNNDNNRTRLLDNNDINKQPRRRLRAFSLEYSKSMSISAGVPSIDKTFGPCSVTFDAGGTLSVGITLIFGAGSANEASVRVNGRLSTDAKLTCEASVSRAFSKDYPLPYKTAILIGWVLVTVRPFVGVGIEVGASLPEMQLEISVSSGAWFECRGGFGVTNGCTWNPPSTNDKFDIGKLPNTCDFSVSTNVGIIVRPGLKIGAYGINLVSSYVDFRLPKYDLTLKFPHEYCVNGDKDQNQGCKDGNKDVEIHSLSQVTATAMFGGKLELDTKFLQKYGLKNVTQFAFSAEASWNIWNKNDCNAYGSLTEELAKQCCVTLYPTKMPSDKPTSKPSSPVSLPTSVPSPLPTSTPSPKSSQTWGDPHVTTFDGVKHDFQGLNAYYYIQQCPDDIFDSGINSNNQTDSNSSTVVNLYNFLPFSVIADHYSCNTIASCINKVEIRIWSDPIVYISIDNENSVTKLEFGDNNTMWECEYNNCNYDDRKLTDLVSQVADEMYIVYTIEYQESGTVVELVIVEGVDAISDINMDTLSTDLFMYFRGHSLQITVSSKLVDTNILCGLLGWVNDDSKNSQEFIFSNGSWISDNVGSRYGSKFKSAIHQWGNSWTLWNDTRFPIFDPSANEFVNPCETDALFEATVKLECDNIITPNNSVFHEQCCNLSKMDCIELYNDCIYDACHCEAEMHDWCYQSISQNFRDTCSIASYVPTPRPTRSPTAQTPSPTREPTIAPTVPTLAPSQYPSNQPTAEPIYVIPEQCVNDTNCVNTTKRCVFIPGGVNVSNENFGSLYTNGYCRQMCDNAVNIVFAMDESGSMGVYAWELEQKFVIDVLLVSVASIDSRVGIIVFDDSARVLYDLATNGNNPETASIIVENAVYNGGGTDILEAMYAAIYQFENLDSIEAQKNNVIILITDGAGNNPCLSSYNIQSDITRKLLDNEIYVIVVGVGSGAIATNLECLNSVPLQGVSIGVDDFDVIRESRRFTDEYTCPDNEYIPWPTQYPTLPSEHPSNAPTGSPSLSPTSSPTVFTPDYVLNLDMDVNQLDDIRYKNEQEFGCQTIGCSVTRTWGIKGHCDDPQLSVKIMETDYSLFIETASVYVNDYVDIGTCDELQNDCTYEWIKCNSITDYNISQYMYDLKDTNIGIADEYDQFITITLAASTSVDSCYVYIDGSYYILYGHVTIKCGLPTNVTTLKPTTSPTYQPTMEPTMNEYYFDVGFDHRFSQEFEISCNDNPSKATGRIMIDVGRYTCMDPKLTMSVLETNFDYYFEYASVYLNNIYLGRCYDVDDSCTDTLVMCNNIREYNISNALQESGRDGVKFVDVAIIVSSSVNRCGYINENGFYCYAHGVVKIKCDLPNNVTTLRPTSSPTIDPTMSPTMLGYYFEVGLNGKFNKTFNFYCTDENHNRAGGKIIIDETNKQCVNPRMSINIVKTDYNDWGEAVDVFLNDIYVGNCDRYDFYSNNLHELAQCRDMIDYNISSHLQSRDDNTYYNWTHQSYSYVAVALVATSTVNSVGFYNDANVYCFIGGEVTIQCDIELPENATTMAPTTSPTVQPSIAPTMQPTIDLHFHVGWNNQFSQTFDFDCSAYNRNEVHGRIVIDQSEAKCTNPRISVSIVETEYDSYWYEYATIFLNGKNISKCSDLQNACTNDLVHCSNVTRYKITSYLQPFTTDTTYYGNVSRLQQSFVDVSLVASLYVNRCPYMTLSGVYCYMAGQVKVQCDLQNNVTTMSPSKPPTTYPTNMPTFDYYYFDVGLNNQFSKKFDIDCSYHNRQRAGGTFIINESQHKCINPRMSISIVETEYSSAYEYATIFINGMAVVNCSDLANNCTLDLVPCSSVTEYDISLISEPLTIDDDGMYVNVTDQLFLDIELIASPYVNSCGYYTHDQSGYVYCFMGGQVKIRCDLPPNVTTAIPSMTPTSIPTHVPSTSPIYQLEYCYRSANSTHNNYNYSDDTYDHNVSCPTEWLNDGWCDAYCFDRGTYHNGSCIKEYDDCNATKNYYSYGYGYYGCSSYWNWFERIIYYGLYGIGISTSTVDAELVNLDMYCYWWYLREYWYGFDYYLHDSQAHYLNCFTAFEHFDVTNSGTLSFFEAISMFQDMERSRYSTTNPDLISKQKLLQVDCSLWMKNSTLYFV